LLPACLPACLPASLRPASPPDPTRRVSGQTRHDPTPGTQPVTKHPGLPPAHATRTQPPSPQDSPKPPTEPLTHAAPHAPVPAALTCLRHRSRRLPLCTCLHALALSCAIARPAAAGLPLSCARVHHYTPRWILPDEQLVYTPENRRYPRGYRVIHAHPAFCTPPVSTRGQGG
jgi:hypothetical protein